jgi:hypothetical protein
VIRGLAAQRGDGVVDRGVDLDVGVVLAGQQMST